MYSRRPNFYFIKYLLLFSPPGTNFREWSYLQIFPKMLPAVLKSPQKKFNNCKSGNGTCLLLLQSGSSNIIKILLSSRNLFCLVTKGNISPPPRLCKMLTIPSYITKLSRSLAHPEKTYLLRKGKYNCALDLLFDWILLLRSKWVFSGTSIAESYDLYPTHLQNFKSFLSNAI